MRRATIRLEIARGVLLSTLFLIVCFSSTQFTFAQARRSVFQSGEELVYKVKFGFIKLGTVVIETGSPAGDGRINARLKFWTADVPFLDTKTLVEDVIDTHAVHLVHFEEHTSNGDKKIEKTMVYDDAAKTLTVSGNDRKTDVVQKVAPFSDALTLVYNMRTWSASNHSYSFPMRGAAGEKIVTCRFTSKKSDQECPAFDEKEIATRIIEGQADLGESAPLGANGKFTVYVTDDAAAVPIRIDMKIAVGSISLVLDKVRRAGWQP